MTTPRTSHKADPPRSVDAALVAALESMLRETARERDALARRVADLEARLDGIEFIDLDDEHWWLGEALEVLAARP